jgi:hypothetical protein
VQDMPGKLPLAARVPITGVNRVHGKQHANDNGTVVDNMDDTMWST